jgi:hypothetical protein
MINRIVNYYVQNEITRQELQDALEGIGFSQEIVNIHLAIADQRKARITLVQAVEHPETIEGWIEQSDRNQKGGG